MSEHKISKSLVPQTKKEDLSKKPQYTLPQALNYVIDGKKITRYEWDNPEIYCYLKGDMLVIYRGDTDKKDYAWSINDGDLLAIDWLVLEGN